VHTLLLSQATAVTLHTFKQTKLERTRTMLSYEQSSHLHVSPKYKQQHAPSIVPQYAILLTKLLHKKQSLDYLTNDVVFGTLPQNL